MPLPVLGAAAQFLLSNGARAAIKKFGSKAINMAKKELKKRDSAIDDMARTTNKGVDRGKHLTKGQKAGFEKRRETGRQNRLAQERSIGPQKSDAFNPPVEDVSLRFGKGGGVRGSGKATKGTRACKMVTMKGS
tara:strand:+ start:195 stop:596 length:402 start_codon:yes stop_codon:yes gene_type:complete